MATHRIHHQHSDREGDPHTPREGTWWAHMGWILMGDGMHHDASVLARYVPDLARDPVHVAISKWHWTSNVVVGLALLAFGGVPYVLWGIFFRTTAGLHATWLVNSATHKWGSRRFATTRRFDEQLVGGAADVRRGLAQQPSRASRPARGTAWPGTRSIRTGSAFARSQALGLAWDVKVPGPERLGVAHGSRLTAQGVVGSSPEPTRPEL